MYQSIMILRGPPKLIHDPVTTIPETAVPIGKKGFWISASRASLTFLHLIDKPKKLTPTNIIHHTIP